MEAMEAIAKAEYAQELISALIDEPGCDITTAQVAAWDDDTCFEWLELLGYIWHGHSWLLNNPYLLTGGELERTEIRAKAGLLKK